MVDDVPEEHREGAKELVNWLGLDDEGNPPELIEELRPYVVERDAGTMICHPLVHTFYHPMENHIFNNMYVEKMKAVEKYEKLHDWFPILFVMYERPYRIDIFRKYMNRFTDKEYWSLLGDVWTDSENIWQNVGEWRALLSSRRKRRQEIMDDDDRAYFREELPDEFQIYRGTSAPDGMGCGMSWTLDEDKAVWFGERHRLTPTVHILSGTVAKSECIAYFNGRKEQEIVVFPEKVYDLETRIS